MNKDGIGAVNVGKAHTVGSSVAGTTFPRPRKSRCAEQARVAELARLRRMSIEDRIAEALSMSDRFSWLQPTEEGR